MYVVKATIHPTPGGKLRVPLSSWLSQATMFGADFWKLDDRAKAFSFSSKRAALQAAREWRDGSPNRSYEIVAAT